MSNHAKRRKRRIALPFLLLAVAALAVSGWQLWAATRVQADSDAQSQLKPETPPGESPLMDFTGLQAQNPDIIAWITISKLSIDYPVVQGTDNSYYLAHTAEGKPNKLGALFLDFRANRDFSGFNSVIYGHYISSGKMFRYLSLMREKEWFGRVTQGVLYTPGKTYRLEFFAAVLADSKSGFYQFSINFPANTITHNLTVVKVYYHR